MADNLPALLPGFRPPAMPTFAMFERQLRPYRRDSGYIEWNISVNPQRHIPAGHCRTILTELDSANVPAPKPAAARLAKLLIGSYPARELSDPQVFVAVITATLASYPVEIGLAAIDGLTRTSKWLPTRAEIVEACELLMEDRRYAVQVAEKHLEEHAAIERRREQRRQWLAKRAERYDVEPWLRVQDRWWPLFPCGRGNDQWFPLIERWVQEFGEATVDAWHQELSDQNEQPKHWYAMRTALEQRAAAARKAYQDELRAEIQQQREPQP